MLTHRNIVAEHAAGARLDRADARATGKAGDHHRAAAVPHLRADGELPGVHDARRHNLLITNPRDMPGFVKELREVPVHAITGVNTLFNALLNTPGFAQARFLAA